jgi:signal transduction histidine kinase
MMFWQRSILTRIVALHVIALTVTAVILSAMLFYLMERSTSALHARAITQLAESLSYFIAPDNDKQPPGWKLTLPDSLNDLYSETYGRYWFVIQDEKGQTLFSSSKLEQLVYQPPTSDSALRLTGRRGNDVFSGLSIRKERFGTPFVIQVAENLSHRDVIIDDVLTEFFPRVGWVVAPLLIFLLLIDVIIFRRVLRPLVAVSEQARFISPQRTGVRLGVEGLPVEVSPLVIAVNNALDRLEAGYRAQRDFSSDAAHELRTPLAILRTKIEARKDKEQNADLLAAVDHMSHVVTQLLQLTEADQFALSAGDRADLNEIAMSVIAMLAPLAIDRKREIELLGSDTSVWVYGHRTLIFRALRNLVENALRFAPERSTVEVSVTLDGKLSVSDQGPGITDAEKELVFQRFWRRDRQTAGNTGLGLAIVRRIAELHEANLTIEDVRPHGVRISMQFKLIRP